MSNFVSLNTALTALRTAQTGMQITSHNIANANTTGYTRQRVNVSASSPYSSPDGPIGTGVNVDDIARIRDTFLDMRLHASNASLGSLEVKSELLGRAEALLGEPDNGVSKELNELWASFDELALRPEDNSVRISVLTNLETLAARVRTVASSLDSLGADARVQLESTIAKVNDQARQLADLNREIVSVQGAGATIPNDLLDRRDLLVDELSRSIGARASFDDNGTARVTVNGYTLVSGQRATTLTVEPDHSVTLSTGGTVQAGGRVAGYQEFLDPATGLLAGVQGDLDDFVSELVTQINLQHAAGTDLDGLPATVPPAAALLSMPGTAGSLTVGITDPRKLAAGSGGGVLDGTNALALAALRTGPPAASPPGTRVLEQVLRSVVTDLGATVASLGRQTTAEQGLNNAAAGARRDHNAVSLDEEMVALMTYQRAYEAAARVATAADQALDTIVNRLGIVGR